jgi:hypothetical protein
LVSDVLNRTQTAMTQEHCFLASELALQAEAQARRLGHLAKNEPMRPAPQNTPV